MAGIPTTNNKKHMSKPWNQNIQFPSDSDFVIRITDAVFGQSKSSGNPMYTIGWELCSPAEKEVAGEVYTLAGIKSGPMNSLYYTTKTLGESDEAAEKSAANLERLVGTGEQTGFLRMALPDMTELVDKFNPENPDEEISKALKGRLLFVQMSPDTNFVRKNPTAEQIAEAKKTGKRPEGDVQVNPVTGKKLVTYLPKVRQVFGLAPSASIGSGGANY